MEDLMQAATWEAFTQRTATIIIIEAGYAKNSSVYRGENQALLNEPIYRAVTNSEISV